MIVEFKNKSLEECYTSIKKAKAIYGEKIGKQFIKKVEILQAIENIDQLARFKTLRFHALTGDKQGLYAINIDEFYRLIFELKNNKLTILIVEVSKHYDD